MCIRDSPSVYHRIMRSAIISYSNFLTSHHIPISNKCFPVFTGGSFELFLKRTVKGAQTFKSTVKAELRDCIIGIFKSLTCISQPGIIQVLVEVFMECFRKNPGQNILADTQISGHACLLYTSVTVVKELPSLSYCKP